jgi:ubiquinone/menaquinone biosynthesis C-methylase UbiE
MTESRTDSIKAMYDERSGHYDGASFHVRLAQDYVRFAALQEGESVLDLACGTGLVTLPAKEAVGKEGHVIGVDISEGMLAVARQKSKSKSLAVEFINHDITDLSDLQLLPNGARGFDVITCAAALVLMEDPLQAIKHWASLLAPGGRLVTEIPTANASIAINIMGAIQDEVGQSLKWDQSWADSAETLEKLLTDGGLVVERVSTTESYATSKHHIDDATLLFDRAVAGPMMRNFGVDGIRAKAEALFLQRFKTMAGTDGVVHQDVSFYVGIGKKM